MPEEVYSDLSNKYYAFWRNGRKLGAGPTCGYTMAQLKQLAAGYGAELWIGDEPPKFEVLNEVGPFFGMTWTKLSAMQQRKS